MTLAFHDRAFHDRLVELEDVRKIVASGRPELVVVYGRRGVGKSALLAEALAGQPHLLYQATTRLMPQQLEDLAAALRAFAPDLVLPGAFPSFDAWLSAIGQIARVREGTTLVVVIDELPYLAQADPSVPSVLQRWWDEVRRERLANLKVFLLGSLVSWMEEQTLSERGPLHNRRTGQIRLEPLSYADAALFYPQYEPVDRLSAYAIWGGLPSYVEEIDSAEDLWSNVRDVVLPPAGRLADEPAWLRFADLRSDAVYSSILRAIAQGNRRPGKIAQAVGRSRADEIRYHLDRLVDLRLVERVVPVHEARSSGSRNSLYLLADNYVAFWYRYVDRLRHLIGLRLYDEALRIIRSDFDKYVSERAFEDECRQFLWLALRAGQLPGELMFEEVGSWWTGEGSDAPSDEIDAVGLSEGHATLVAECKWSAQPVGRRDLEGLRAALYRAATQLRPIDRPWRALFSRSGFDDDLVALAADPAERILLFKPDDLYRV